MNKTLKIIATACYFLKIIILLIIGITLFIESKKSINILTNNQLLGLLILLFILLILNKRGKRRI